jgi:hypothetical protein
LASLPGRPDKWRWILFVAGGPAMALRPRTDIRFRGSIADTQIAKALFDLRRSGRSIRFQGLVTSSGHLVDRRSAAPL